MSNARAIADRQEFAAAQAVAVVGTRPDAGVIRTGLLLLIGP